MATDMQRLIVSLEAQTKKFENALNKANGVANKRARAIESRFALMNKNATAGLARLGGAFAGAAALRGAQELIDASIRVENALKIAGLSGENLTHVYDELFKSAQRNAAPLEALAKLYGRAALAQKELNVTQEEMISFADNVGKALRVAGTSAEQSRGALIQLSQAIGAGIVRAEEFNAILEGALPIAQAAAAGLDEAGGSVAKLRKLIIDGKVSSEAFFRAFEAGSKILDEKVVNAEYTVSQGFVRLQNVLIATAGQLNTATGASDTIGTALSDLATTVKEVGDYFERNADRVAAFFNAIGDGINTVENAKKSLREFLGLDKLDDFLEGTSLIEGRIGFASDQVAGNIQSRIDAGFGDITTAGKGGRLKPGAASVTPVKLSDFPITGDDKTLKGRAAALQREIEQIRERTKEIRANTAAQSSLNPLIDDYGYAVERAKAVTELENAAKRAGIELTPKLRDRIQLLAEGYATASAAGEKLNETQDRVRKNAEEMKQLGKEVLGGFIRDLQSGTSAADALNNALERIADTLLDKVLDSIFQINQAGGPGGGGGGGGFLDQLLGGLFNTGGGSSFISTAGAGLFADGGIAAHGRRQPLPRFARGGVSNTAAIFGEAGPEAAVPLPDGRRIPVDLRVPNISASMPPQQRLHITVGASVDDDGKLLAFVQKISGQTAGQVVSVAAPGIIERSKDASGAALARGDYDAGMAKYGTKLQPKVR